MTKPHGAHAKRRSGVAGRRTAGGAGAGAKKSAGPWWPAQVNRDADEDAGQNPAQGGKDACRSPIGFPDRQAVHPVPDRSPAPCGTPLMVTAAAHPPFPKGAP
ncbi:hypothetical protein GCM10009099_43620 [Caenispirillum bisanense]